MHHSRSAEVSIGSDQDRIHPFDFLRRTDGGERPVHENPYITDELDDGLLIRSILTTLVLHEGSSQSVPEQFPISGRRFSLSK